MASSVTLKALQERLGPIQSRMREMVSAVDKDGRAWSAEEQTEWDKLDNEAGTIETEMGTLRASKEAAEKRQKALDRVDGLGKQIVDPPPAPSPGSRSEEKKPEVKATCAATSARDFWKDRNARDYRAAFGPRWEPDYTLAFRSFLRSGSRGMTEAEQRALQVDLDTSGGYIVASELFVNELIKAVDNQVFMRQLGRVFPLLSAESLGVPSLDADPADPTWTGELLTGTEDSTMAFGKRTLTPHPLAKSIKVSRTLLRKSVLPVESLVTDRLAYKFGTTLENIYLNGIGGTQPLGVFVADASGISTGRDVSTGNTTTTIEADNLIHAKYTLKPQYHAAARWMFHRNVVRDIRKLKDGNGQYLWQAGLVGDRPSTILETPFVMSEYAPSTMTRGLYVGILGDFSFYWIVDALNLEVQRLDELYAATNQIGFIGRMETDGMPVLEEAFVRVALAP